METPGSPPRAHNWVPAGVVVAWVPPLRRAGAPLRVEATGILQGPPRLGKLEHGGGRLGSERAEHPRGRHGLQLSHLGQLVQRPVDLRACARPAAATATRLAAREGLARCLSVIGAGARQRGVAWGVRSTRIARA
jgi:hypothetical protein